MRKVSSVRGDPTPAQEESWSPDEMLEMLLSYQTKPIGRGAPLTEFDVKCCLSRVKKLLNEEPSMLEVEAPVKVVGDIHGQFPDLLRLFGCGGFPPEVRYLFLGDYVDRGPFGMECFCLLACFKIKYPDNVFLLRGNHESGPISRIYGFHDEVKRRFSVKVWKLFIDTFCYLPLAAQIDRKIFCVHAGLSPEMTSPDVINTIHRPTEIPEEGIVCDLLWSDPEPGITGWAANDRGVSFTYGADIVSKFLERNNLDLIVRAHQVVEDGYEFFAQRQLVTVFSAPHYCGEYDNAGAMMSVREDLMCSFQLLKPATDVFFVSKEYCASASHMALFEFPAYRSQEWLDWMVASAYFPPDMLRKADITPAYMAANPTAGLYRAKTDETFRQIRRALFRHALFKIQNVEVATSCADKLRTLVSIEPNEKIPHNWIDWLGGTVAEGQKFFTEETWTVERCGQEQKYFVRYYREGGDGFSTRVLPGSWWDRVQMMRYYFGS